MSRLPNAVPKPKRRPKSARTPIARGKRPKPVNAKRKAAEFRRCYHSLERVEFVKRLPCAVPCCDTRPSENAHVGKQGKGAGRKANADQIAPLCCPHHRELHRTGTLAIFAPLHRDVIADYWTLIAARTEALWLATSTENA